MKCLFTLLVLTTMVGALYGFTPAVAQDSLATSEASITTDQLVQPQEFPTTWGRIKDLYRMKDDKDGVTTGLRPESSSRFPYSQCTWYAASEFDKVAPWPGCNWSGNAGTWTSNASAAGWRTYGGVLDAAYRSLPVGSVVVWTGGGYGYGHVAVLRQVVQNGIYIQEKNWPYGSGVSPWRYLGWSNVYYRSGYQFSGYIAPWRK